MTSFDRHTTGEGLPDMSLLDAVRKGDPGAYGELFQRHAEPVRLAARHWASQATEQQDLVAETFAQTLNAIHNGAGPHENLRPYLLTTVRRLGIISWRHRSRLVLYGTEPRDAPARWEVDNAAVDENAQRWWNIQLARSAFHTLPLRWQLVLWHTEVESRSPTDLAPRLGISPNAVAALAMRAREGLRRAYLQAHVPQARARGCVAVRQRLGAWTRRGLSARRARHITDHLATCADCHQVANTLATTNQELK